MATPKKKTSKSKRDMRRSHDALSTNACVECPKCGEMMRPHHVCPSCGHYNNRAVLVKKEKPNASAPPWLLTEIPFNPKNIAPL